MNEEMKDTLEKVASYNEMLNLKSMRKGIIIMSIVFIIMVQISMWKEVSPAPLVSLICAYNGATFISKAKESKDKSDFITGSIFFVAMLLNTIAFIVKWLTSHIKGYVAGLVDELEFLKRLLVQNKEAYEMLSEWKKGFFDRKYILSLMQKRNT